MRAIALLLLAGACSGSPRAPEKVTTVAPDAAPDAAVAQPWQYGQPIPCTTVDDCMVVGPDHFNCRGECGFCPGQYLAPRGFPMIKCPPPPPKPVIPPGMPPPVPPNCSPCGPGPSGVAACEANVCVMKPA